MNIIDSEEKLTQILDIEFKDYEKHQITLEKYHRFETNLEIEFDKIILLSKFELDSEKKDFLIIDLKAKVTSLKLNLYIRGIYKNKNDVYIPVLIAMHEDEMSNFI